MMYKKKPHVIQVYYTSLFPKHLTTRGGRTEGDRLSRTCATDRHQINKEIKCVLLIYLSSGVVLRQYTYLLVYRLYSSTDVRAYLVHTISYSHGLPFSADPDLSRQKRSPRSLLLQAGQHNIDREEASSNPISFQHLTEGRLRLRGKRLLVYHSSSYTVLYIISSQRAWVTALRSHSSYSREKQRGSTNIMIGHVYHTMALPARARFHVMRRVIHPQRAGGVCACTV